MCKGKNVISFTLPTDEPEVLEAAGNMLLGLAGKTPVAGEGAGGYAGPIQVIPAPDPAVATVPAPPAPEAPAAMPPAAAAPPAPEAPAAAPLPPDPAIATVRAPAPPVPPAAPPVPGPAVELDADGFPWDARIHAATKTKMASTGAWKLKRGSDPAIVEQVRAEHVAASAGTSAAPPVAPEAPAVTPAPPVAPEASAAPTTFPDIVAIVHNKQAMELLTVEDIQGVCNAYGLPSFPALAAKQELIPEVYQALEAIWTSKTTV